MSTVEELVVLLDEDGRAVGTAAKASVHHERTPLHLAFSCYVFDSDGRLLVTRRALGKATFPGVWTNSVCGHPAPGEPLEEAVRRRATDELGITLDGVRLVVPAFRYDATMPNGVRENELCPVLVAHTADVVTPDPDEVEDIEWASWSSFRDDVLAGVRDVSPWCVQQIAALAECETSDGAFTTGDPADLPAAARP